MNPQPVPAPGFSQAQQEPPQPKAVTLRWGLAALALIVAGGFIFERIWLSSVAPVPLSSVPPTSIPSAIAEVQPPPSALTPVTPRNVEPVVPAVDKRGAREVAANRRETQEQDIGQRAEQALQAVRLFRLQSTADAAEKELRSLQTQLDAWNDSIDSLMTDDRGRRIASDPDRLELLAEMLKSTQVTQEQIADWEAELDLLLDPLHASQENVSSARLPGEFTSELNNLRTSVRTARDELQDRHAALDAMASQAKDDQLASDAPTMQDALAQRRADAAQNREALLAEARRQARAEINQQLVEAEAQRETAEGRVKLLEIQAQKEQAEDIGRTLADALAEAARLREEARLKAELMRRFEREWPAMQAYLIPFTTEGFTQPGGYGFERTTEKGPVSFGKLQGMGVLKKDIRSQQGLYYITTANGMNDRDNGAFPDYHGGAADWANKHETIQSIQNFLNEYGPILVEKHQLAP